MGVKLPRRGQYPLCCRGFTIAAQPKCSWEVSQKPGKFFIKTTQSTSGADATINVTKDLNHTSSLKLGYINHPDRFLTVLETPIAPFVPAHPTGSRLHPKSSPKYLVITNSFEKSSISQNCKSRNPLPSLPSVNSKLLLMLRVRSISPMKWTF